MRSAISARRTRSIRWYSSLGMVSSRALTGRLALEQPASSRASPLTVSTRRGFAANILMQPLDLDVGH